MFQTIKTVLKHALVYGFGDILAKLVGFLLIPLYTHYFTPEQYGTLELLDLTSHVISLILAMGLCQAMVRFYFESSEQEYRDQVISVSLILTWVVSLLGLAILLPSSSGISLLVFERADFQPYFTLLFFAIALSLCIEVPLQLLRIEQRSLFYTSISLVRLVIQLSLNIYFIVVLEWGISGILWSTLITNILATVYLTWGLLRRTRLTFSWSLCKDMLAYSLPLLTSWAGNFMLHFADRFLLQRLASLSQVGVYALSYKFGFLLNVFVLSPFKRTWQPKQFEIAEQPDAPQTFARVFTYYTFAQLFCTLGISVLIEDVLSIIAEEQYHSAHYNVPVILLAYNFNGFYQLLDFGLLYKKKTPILGAITLSAALINILSNYWLIPMYGAFGAALSTLIAFAYLAAVTYVIAQRLFYIPIEFYRVGGLCLYAALLFGCSRLVVLDSVVLSMLARGALAFAFPLILLWPKFLKADEREIVQRLWTARDNWREVVRSFRPSR
jgi:O-antigen/teichoic acid export membrane protein